MQAKRIPVLWEKPGQEPNGENPWRGKNQDQGPPDLDQLLRQLTKKIKKFFSGNGGGTGEPRETGGGAPFNPFRGFGQQLLMGILVLYVASGIYIVDPPERAVVTRFGKFVRTEKPGPHWIPTFIESQEIVNVEQVATSDHSGLMLTRDGNIVSVGVAVQYRVGAGDTDVRDYLFNVVNPERSLDQSTESALRQVVGQSTMDEVLTLKRAEIAEAIKTQTIETLAQYHTGITVLDVVMQFAKAPDEVRAAFDEVIKAAADEERLVNQAKAYENEVIPKAKGVAEQLRNEAMGYREEKILMAKGNTARFNLLVPYFLKSPKVMQSRLYLDTMEEVLGRVNKVVIDEGAGKGGNMIYLPLDRLLPAKEPLEATTVQTGEKNP